MNELFKVTSMNFEVCARARALKKISSKAKSRGFPDNIWGEMLALSSRRQAQMTETDAYFWIVSWHLESRAYKWAWERGEGKLPLQSWWRCCVTSFQKGFPCFKVFPSWKNPCVQNKVSVCKITKRKLCSRPMNSIPIMVCKVTVKEAWLLARPLGGIPA